MIIGTQHKAKMQITFFFLFTNFFVYHLFTICLRHDGSMNQYISVDKEQLLYLKLSLSGASGVVRKRWWIFHMAAIVICRLPGADTFKEVKRIKPSELHDRKDIQAWGWALFLTRVWNTQMLPLFLRGFSEGTHTNDIWKLASSVQHFLIMWNHK